MAENTNKNGLGVAGFVVALVGFLLTLVPLIRVVGAIICIIGFILALIAVFKKPRILAIIGIALSIAGWVIYYVKWHQLKVALETAVQNMD
jgi:membrane-bound ClpP family serine protease